LAIQAKLSDRSATVTVPDALQITGPLPQIVSSQLSLPPGLDISLRPSEFPAGYMLTAVVDVRNIDPKSELHLICAEGNAERPALHIGSQDSASSLQRLSGDQLFLSYDTSTFPAGCNLQAVLDNGRAGRSQPYTLAHLVRLPRIVSLTPTANRATTPAGLRALELIGDNLAMIGQLAWDQSAGIDVVGLPAAIPGQGQRQTLTVNLPEAPGPAVPLYLWLRGEASARATTVTLPGAGNGPSRADSSSPLLP
jgi:hypothetical protein